VPHRTHESASEASAPGFSPAVAPWYARLPWFAILLTFAVLLSSTFGILPIRDARTFEAVPEAHMVVSPGYVLLAPLSTTLDMLTLLSRRQDIAFVVGGFVLVLLWRGLAAIFGRPTWRRHVASIAGTAVLILVAYVAAAVLPRPMAAITTDDTSIIIIDFHTHTSASHDGRSGWSVEDTRAWHAAAGFDVAYITDHNSVAAAEQGTAANPVPAANGVTLLQGIETGWNGEHVGVLGAQRMYKGILTADLKNVDTNALRLASTIPGREPVLVWNHPRQIGRLPAAGDSMRTGVRAIELHNGDPSVMDRLRAAHDSIVRFADRSNIALTTGTDNHGWGKAAPNWTLMQIIGWRAMSGDELENAIETTLRQGRYGITRVVERTEADPGGPAWQVMASAVTAPWTMFRAMSAEERVSWLIWTWLIAGAAWWWRARRDATG
jgi:predicted metal-dependent phosphoesterase TrpH